MLRTATARINTNRDTVDPCLCKASSDIACDPHWRQSSHLSPNQLRIPVMPGRPTENLVSCFLSASKICVHGIDSVPMRPKLPCGFAPNVYAPKLGLFLCDGEDSPGPRIFYDDSRYVAVLLIFKTIGVQGQFRLPIGEQKWTLCIPHDVLRIDVCNRTNLVLHRQPELRSSLLEASDASGGEFHFASCGKESMLRVSQESVRFGDELEGCRKDQALGLHQSLVHAIGAHAHSIPGKLVGRRSRQNSKTENSITCSSPRHAEALERLREETFRPTPFQPPLLYSVASAG